MFSANLKLDVHIASFLDFCELGLLSRVARRFGGRSVTALGVVEETARQQLAQMGVRECPENESSSSSSWLWLLWRTSEAGWLHAANSGRLSDRINAFKAAKAAGCRVSLALQAIEDLALLRPFDAAASVRLRPDERSHLPLDEQLKLASSAPADAMAVGEIADVSSDFGAPGRADGRRRSHDMLIGHSGVEITHVRITLNRQHHFRTANPGDLVCIRVRMCINVAACLGVRMHACVSACVTLIYAHGWWWWWGGGIDTYACIKKCLPSRV